ncbi:MAG: DUF3999 family protein [Planctomycetota bacterium]|nr:DUF3999 family protein [Planctomycetota bacterium]
MPTRQLLQGLIVCLLIGLGTPAGAETPVRFRFWKPLDRGPSQDEEIVACILDSAIYAATRAGFPDLRVVDEAEGEVPYQLEPDMEFREERTRQPFATEVVSLHEDGNAIEVRVRLPKKSPSADGLNFTTPQADYERKVQVFGSADGADWKPLVTDCVIFDYSRYMDVSNREIVLPANDFREFKLLIGEVTDEKESPYKELTRTFRGGKEDERVERTTVQRRTFRIDRIGAWGTVTQQRVRKARTAAYSVAGFEAQEDSAKKQTLLAIRTRREPLTSFTLETPSRNFSRRVTLEIPVVQGVKTEWREIGNATVSNFGFRNYHRERLQTEFPEQREAQYRLVIHNEDNPPLEITGVKAEGHVHRVVWLAQKAKVYRVFYGSETAETPKYEAATVLAALRSEEFQPVAAKLGVEAENASFSGEPDVAVRKLLDNWVFLGGVIGLMVIALGWSLFRAGRHLERLPPDETSNP